MKNWLQLTKRVSTIEHIILDVFDLKPKWFLDNWLIKYLKWNGSIKNHEQIQEIITYKNLDAKPLFAAILSALDDAGWRGDMKPIIIMGAEEFCEFTSNKEVHMSLRFNTGPLRFGGQSHDWYAEVRVYPHIKGVAVI